MKKIIYTIATIFLLLPVLTHAQYFRAFADYQGNDIVFYVQPNPGGGDISTGWSDMEFFLRYPTGAPVFSYGAITINSTNFPGISMPYNGDNVQGSETGYNNSWFGTSYSPTANQTYTDGQVYEVFRVTLSINPATVAFELVHNTGFFPTYLALVNQVGGDLSSTGSTNKFYGTSENCMCPSPSNNDRLILGNALPVELVAFNAEAVEHQTKLTWETKSETNNRGFEIQRRDQDGKWKNIGFVEGQGHTNESQLYEYYDRRPLLGTNYYRLKQWDFDGQFELSEVRSVRFDQKGIQIAIYPNPAHYELHLDQAFTGTLLIHDALGRTFWEAKQAKDIQQIDISNIPVGTYFLELVDLNNQWQTLSFLIQR